MARHGITYDDVITAANTLKAQAKSVTIENVRAILGTGSSGTINQHLHIRSRHMNNDYLISNNLNSRIKLRED